MSFACHDDMMICWVVTDGRTDGSCVMVVGLEGRQRFRLITATDVINQERFPAGDIAHDADEACLFVNRH